MKLSFEKKIGLAFVALFVGIVVMGAITYRNNQAAQNLHRTVQHAYAVLNKSDETLSAVQTVVLNTRAYIVTGDSSYLQTPSTSVTQLDEKIAALRSLVNTYPLQQRRVDTLKRWVDKRIEFSTRTIEARKHGRLMNAQVLVATGDGEHSMEQITSIIGRIMQTEEGLLTTSQTALTASRDAFNDSFYVLFGAMSGLVCGMFFMIRHYVLSKRKSEEQIRKLSEFQNIILNGTDYSIISTTDPDGIVTMFNKGAEAMLGYKAGEMVGITSPAIIHDADEVAARARVLSEELKREVKPGVDVFHIKSRLGYTADVNEWTYIRKDGTRLTVELSITTLRDKANAISGYLGIAKDITETKKQRERVQRLTTKLERMVEERTHQLEQSQYFLEKAQAVAHAGHWVYDKAHGDKVKWSDEAHNIFGITKEAFDGRLSSFHRIVHPDDLDTLRAKSQHAIQENGHFDMEFRVILSDGNVRWVYTVAETMRNNADNSVTLIGVVKDITREKIADMERRQITEELIKQNRDLSQFAFIVSHNLRAPLANITGLSDALKMPTLPDAIRQKFTEELTKAAHKMDDVLSDINVILQVKRQDIDKKQTIRFSTLVKDIEASIATHLRNENASLKTDFTEVDEMLTMKPYLYSVFYNLISNSIKYRQETQPPVIEINSVKTTDGVRLIFKDNGMGINMEKDGAQVFGLYKRFHKEKEGKGMGLYMVKTQVESLGGSIAVNSAPNAGTVFTIEFKNAA